MTASPENLARSSAAIAEGAGEAIAWIAENRATSQRLDREAAALVERLRKARNLCRRLGAAATRPLSVAFFGISQAGKSHMISALARGANGRLETVLDGERLDFIEHVNPPGGGTESTGLVTRFTRRQLKTVPGYPVHLDMLSEADIVKILGNSFLCDFDREKVSFTPDAERIAKTLQAVRGRRQTRAPGGLSEDDVTDIRDYFERRFPRSTALLPADYWPQAIDLAPYLLPDDRARLFAVLWGELDEFTQAYLLLCKILAGLAHAPVVDAPVAILVERAGGAYTQKDSIMNVSAVKIRFARDPDDLIGVVPVVDGEPRTEVRVQRSLLAALTKEMVCSLAEPPQVDLLETIDLLDFPGYRGRLGIATVAEAAIQDKGADPMGALILRGKVAYLFERYTDDQEMNVLVLCSASDKQIEITDLGPVLESWVWATQGRTPETRARRPSGLLYALTMLDRRIKDNIDQSASNLAISWDGMMYTMLMERFGRHEWVQNWSGGRPFDTMFLVRKPGMARGVIDSEGGVERGTSPGAAEGVARLRATFAASEAVQRHFQDPGQIWDAMIAPEDGGMSLVVAHLRAVALPEVKIARIAEQIRALEQDLTETQLGGYYRADGADAVERKKRIVDMVLAALQRRLVAFGEVLHALQPSPEALRSLYVNAEDTVPEAPSPSAPAEEEGGLISLSLDGFLPEADSAGSAAPAPAAAPASGRAARFGKAAISEWIRSLRALPQSQETLDYFRLPGEVIQALVDEIITGAMRFRLEEKLVAALHGAEIQASTTRSKLADQQVRVTCAIIDDYVDWLGFSALPAEQRPASKVPGARIFATPAPIDGLPRLTAMPLNHTAAYILDWFEGFRAVTIGNAGHSAGAEISPEQNERLGRIIGHIASATLGGA